MEKQKLQGMGKLPTMSCIPLTEISSSLTSIQRWVWLEVAAPPADGNPEANSVVYRHYVPEGIVREIPGYKDQLDKQLGSIKGGSEPIIRDTYTRDPQIVSKAIRFLASGYLTPIDNSPNDCQKTLDSLVELYLFGNRSETRRLRKAVLFHIHHSEALTLEVFLPFARSCYELPWMDPELGLWRLLKRKLAEFLPRIQQTVSVNEISSEGGMLGKQLFVVLLEYRAKGQGTLGSNEEFAIEFKDD
jgi:hypothetical protein